MSKSPDFIAGLRKVEERHAVQRHPKPELPPETAPARVPSRRGKVSITHWVDPAVRRQVAQLALDTDKHQGDFMNEALNLLFEKYGKPQIT
jgi:hypothetical protein